MSSFEVYFTGESEADIGEGHWGIATFSKKALVLKAYQRFDYEEFLFVQN